MRMRSVDLWPFSRLPDKGIFHVSRYRGKFRRKVFCVSSESSTCELEMKFIQCVVWIVRFCLRYKRTTRWPCGWSFEFLCEWLSRLHRCVSGVSCFSFLAIWNANHRWISDAVYQRVKLFIASFFAYECNDIVPMSLKTNVLNSTNFPAEEKSIRWRRYMKYLTGTS